jgi:hypothetical protein
MTKNRKKITAENFFKFFFDQKLHPTLQNMNFYKLLSTFWGHFALLDPDPDPYSGSGSMLPIEYGSNTDPDPDPRFQLNTDPIRIRIHNPGSFSTYLVLFSLWIWDLHGIRD